MSRKTEAGLARTIGIDTGKNTLHLVGLDDKGAVVLREKLARGRIAARLANVPPCLIGIEAGMVAFQMGVPSQGAFPFKLWSRILARETRRAAAAPVTYPDPRGDPELRKEVAAYLGLARGIRCSPSQVLVTGGFSGALGRSA